MKKLRHSKPVALFVAFLMLLQLLPIGTALAAGGRDLLTDGWVKIHNDTGQPVAPWEGAPAITSSIEIKDKNGTTIVPDGSGDYSEIPAEATIDLKIGFHFEVPEHEELDPGDYFSVSLPTGLNFTGLGLGPITGKLKNENDQEFADWKIEDGKLTVTINSGIMEVVTNLWGKIEFTGEFEYLEDTDPSAETTKIQFGAQIITITRKSKENDPKPPEKSVLDKSYEYDPTTNEITWTVNITPPGGVEDNTYDYSGFTLIDKLTGKHTFVSGSFQVNNTAATPDVSGDNKTITYKFPDNHTPTGKQTITYKTTPAFEATGNNFKNTVNLKLGDHPAAEEVEESFGAGGFFAKTSGTVILGSDGQSAYVPWTVTVTLPRTPNESFIYPNAKIIDTLATGNHVFYEDASYPVTIKFPGGSEQVVKSDGTTNGTTGSYALSSSNGVLTYDFPGVHPATSTDGPRTYVLTYYTKIANWNTSVDTNGSVSVKNGAKFAWEHTDGPGVGTWEGAGVGVDKTVVASGGWISKGTTSTADFDHEAAHTTINGDYIKWTVVVNRNKIEMGKVHINDAVTTADGHEFVIDSDRPLVVKKNNEGEVPYTANGTGANGTLSEVGTGGFRFDFPDPAPAKSTDTYTVTFYTKITEAGLDSMYRNSSSGNHKTFENKVTLHGHSGSTTVSATKTYRLQMLDKSVAEPYDHTTRTVKWKLVVNRNRLEMTDAVVTDFLPEHMVLFPNSEEAFEVKVNDGAVKTLSQASIGFAQVTGPKSGFALALPAGTHTDKYEITFSTRLEDEALLQGWDGTKDFTNEAELELDEAVGKIMESETTGIRNTVIKKTHNYVVGSAEDVVHWSVEINPGQVSLENAVIEDILHDALNLDPDSVKLYHANVQANGSLVKSTLVELGADDLTTGIKEDGAHEGKEFFTLKLPAGPHAYILEFDTVITQDEVTITNTITLTGSDTSASGESSSTGIAVGNLFSQGGSGAYTLTVKKVDENGEPMQGVAFTLLASNLQPFNYRGSNPPSNRQLTGEDGTITFTALPNWSFYVREDPDTMPAGYLAAAVAGGVRPTDQTVDGAHITVVNHRAEADVAIYKVSSGESKQMLTGGTFKISGESAVGAYENTVSAVNGVVAFEKVPVNAAGQSYTIEEVTPPSGYSKTNDKITVTVRYTDESKTAVQVVFADGSKYDPEGEAPELPALENTRIPYVPSAPKAQVIKVDEKGSRLAGATFTLYDSNGSAVASMTTGSNGIAEFVGLTSGRAYTIRETSAPDGYLLSDESFSFTAQADQTHTFTMTNEKIDEEPETPEEPKTPEEPEEPEIPEVPENPTGLSGSLTILKLNRADIPLSGAEFTLYGAAGNVLAIAVSGADGKVRFDYLAPGTYNVEETKAPEGYRLFAETLTVEITAENLNLGYTLRNAAEQDPPEVAGWEDDPVPLGEAPGTLPKTGEVPVSVYLLVAGLGLLGTGLVTLLPRKKSGKRVAGRKEK